MLEGKKISIVIPAYNEEGNIPLFYARLKELLSKLPCAHEIIFVDDGSTDRTREEMEKLEARDANVCVLEFSRNFGKECATTAGIRAASGDACILIDADLQHPVEAIPEFLKKWGDGAEVVVGVRTNDPMESIIKKVGSYFFYKIMNRISEVPFIPRSTDFRLLDRSVVDAYNELTERERMTRILIAWLGFKRDFVYFAAGERALGKASYSLPKLIKLSISTFVGHSLLPLKVAGYLGVFITIFSGILGAFIITEKYILNDPWSFNFSGPAMLAVFNLFLIGIVLSCLGLVAMYVAQIHGEVLNRPLYVLRKKKNKGV
jgi:dolichol-phosphate mannosyltransferase